MKFLHMLYHWLSGSTLLQFFGIKHWFTLCRFLYTFHAKLFISTELLAQSPAPVLGAKQDFQVRVNNLDTSKSINWFIQVEWKWSFFYFSYSGKMQLPIWQMKYREIEFQLLGKESSPFLWIKWFHIQIKIAFFH